ncbi:MAG: hypothetical protein ACJAS4_002364 [Bacteriovoracaceae bacterium]|jgi:hypothetical protein
MKNILRTALKTMADGISILYAGYSLKKMFKVMRVNQKN